MTKPTKPYAEMNVGELAEATAEFNREFIIDSFHPLTPEARARWERAKRKPGRPKEGKGSKVISVSVEKSLLEKCDRLAKRKRVSRASLIARGLRHVLAQEPERPSRRRGDSRQRSRAKLPTSRSSSSRG